MRLQQADIQYGTRKRLRSVLLARRMYDCIVSNYAGIHGVNTIERRYGTYQLSCMNPFTSVRIVSIARIVSTLTYARYAFGIKRRGNKPSQRC